jgi:hypothetical protein
MEASGYSIFDIPCLFVLYENVSPTESDRITKTVQVIADRYAPVSGTSCSLDHNSPECQIKVPELLFATARKPVPESRIAFLKKVLGLKNDGIYVGIHRVEGRTFHNEVMEIREGREDVTEESLVRFIKSFLKK